MTRSNAALLVYDGDCAFCQRSIDVATRVLPEPFRAEPYQFLPLEDLGLTADQASTAVWWVQPSRPARSGHEAVAGLVQAQHRWWWTALGWMIEHPPVSALAARAYAVIARNRHRLPGGTAQCRVPANSGVAAPTPGD